MLLTNETNKNIRTTLLLREAEIKMENLKGIRAGPDNN